MMCTALLILSALALGSAVPIGSVYDHGYASFPKTYADDYVKDVLSGHPFYGKHIAGVHDIDDVYRAGVWPEHDVADRFGDDLHKKRFVKEKQWEEDKHLDEQHRLQHIHMLQEQKLLHELQHQQHTQLQEQKEALDHLHHIQEQEVHDQMEKLDAQQFAQKLQLDELHAIEDEKVAAHSVHPAFWHGNEHSYSAWNKYDADYEHPDSAWHKYVSAVHPGAFWHATAAYGHPAFWHKSIDSARWGPYAAVHDVRPWGAHQWGVHPWTVHQGIHNFAY